MRKLKLYNLTEEQARVIDEMEVEIEAEPLLAQPKYILESTGTWRDYQVNF